MIKLSLFPKDKKFFVLFNNLSQCLVEITTEFQNFLQDYEDKPIVTGQQTRDLVESSVSLRKIIDLDSKGDGLSEDLLKTLFSTFVTPMDREDIHALTKTLTSIIEHINGAARRFDMYQIKTVEPAALELSQILIESTSELKFLIERLDNLSSLERFTPHIEKLSQLEKAGDKIYRTTIKKLFCSAGESQCSTEDTLHIIKWQDIFECLENAIDKCNSAGTILMGIILKYA
ncbi:hypothetical protein COW36_00585 [bacterium (Candidatus Blackallbacteria) CG17_big_fil_post_rev_8_21_14_2_50_48_46]|uniref:DUF47 domain-containing protein n=1 Tax=bacterium (Candidatus Blackallbacteria) CG17_big_fil_post_rev_8_21_14_2_50_48_46 TaxID=2014261 RepID=A0A2M7GB10_9BACT|nr:MAG: hypothetical protein COW64_10590 [bacterium (Candidatus Blackallbacteria) CG18_big_fil_WC_8_21_14_2_50_49_26]PIW19369.1 MAG: hypothetical protein COW36_00585 [bacterium (Candidatus Blackallbacteria) CG17_big_fil_post_rev_8_21_14_2_50_48_46]PIW49027.1 MAG: hypothetical protein COW20_07870 [bacterium (Candidatus Blackallbacteria) CG13_big_fil_rev_8_21_14_2_50_49_14]